MMFKGFGKGITDSEAVEKLLDKVKDPVLGQGLGSLGALRACELAGTTLSVTLALGYPFAGIRESLAEQLRETLAKLDGVESVQLDLIAEVPPQPGEKSEALAQVKSIVAVASGKGGVGKSTTAVNLALALSAEGAKVGLLDADIYGPSQPQMLGIGPRYPEIIDNKWMIPIEAHGIKSNSMGYMVTDKTPMVWRGPMVSGAFQQLVNQTQWGELDYLIIDMPPGTGDIQLTLSQTVPVSGAVIVTTPQDIALLDARKGIEMFQKVNVPVLGIVENMATHICSNCGHEEHIFGKGGGEQIAKTYQTALLGSLPLDLHIREEADGGNPSVSANPESPTSQEYRRIARRVGAQLWHLSRQTQAPEIVTSDD